MRHYSKYLIAIFVLLGTVWLILAPAQYAGPAVNRWTPTADMSSARALACSALLQDGRILVAGGNTANGVSSTVDLYSANGSFSTIASMQQARAGAACVTLQDGRVLVTGGTDGVNALASAEVFNPATGAWTSLPNMAMARTGHTATLLPWGAVLIVGGENSGTVEAYATNDSFVTIGQLSSPRQSYAVAPLRSHKVLILGGTDGNSTFNTIDLYDALANSITPAGQMLTARRNFGAAELLDGTVLITGGYDARGNILKSTEIFDPAKGESVAGPDLQTARAEHQSYALPGNGTVLLVGGTDGHSTLTNTEAYPYWAGKFMPAAPMNTARSGLTATLMKRGGLVVAGGRNSSGFLPGSEAYGFATMLTNKPDYQPGDTAIMTGAGWKPGEQVQIQVSAMPADQHNVEFTGTATADASGQINLSGFHIDESHLGMRFLLTATGSDSIAQMSFTDLTATTTTITSVNPPPPQVAPATVTVQTNVNQAAASGTITLFVNGISTATGTMDQVTGNNTFSGVSIPVGNGNTISATYNGDATYSTSTGIYSGDPYVVTPVSTTTSLVGAGAVNYGQNLTITANITPTVPNNSGQVSFTDTSNNNAVLGTVQVSGSAGTIVLNTLKPGSHIVTATFSPNNGSIYGVSTSSPQTYTVNTIAPTFTLSSSPTTPTTGQPFTLTLTSTATNNTFPTGTVQFKNGVSNIGGLQSLSNGQASISVPGGLTAGSSTYAISAQYLGDTIYTSATPGLTLTVAKGTPVITITTNPSGSVQFGSSVTYTATLTNPTDAPNNTTVPVGTVAFSDGTNTCAAAPVNTSGVATCGPFSNVPVSGSPHTISGAYSGDTNFNTVTGTTTLTVTGSTTSTTITTSPTTVNIGTTVTYTVNVTETPNANPPQSAAAVVVTDNGNTVCSSNITVANPATLSTPCQVAYTNGAPGLGQGGGAGSHTVIATYTSSSGSVAGSASAPLTVTVVKPTPSVAFTTTSSTITYGNSTVNETAAITPFPATPPYTGGIQFSIDNVATGSPVAMVAGAATSNVNNTPLSGGTHAITAQFVGDADYNASNTAGPITVTVNPATPTVSSATYTASFGGTVAGGTITVTGAAGGSAPTGTIAITSNGTAIGGPFTLGSPAGNQSSVNVGTLTIPTSLGVGTGMNLTITYTPAITEKNYTTANFSGANLTVNKANVTVTTNTSPANQTSGPLGTSVTFTATVTPAGNGSVGGNVIFSDNGSAISGSIALTNGTASFTTSSLLVNGGTAHTISAAYTDTTGNFNNGSNVGTPYSYTVTKGNVTINVSANPTTVTSGSPITLTAQVIPVIAAPGGLVPTAGTVTFKVDGNTVGTSGLTTVAGVATATFTWTSTSGSHAVTASWDGTGDANFNGQGTSNSFTVTANATPTTTTLNSPTAGTYTYGQTITLTATVAPQAPATGTPTGSVIFYVNGTNALTAAQTLVGGTVTTTIPTLTPSATPQAITVVYTPASGSQWATSSSAATNVTVNKATPTMTLFGGGGAPGSLAFGTTLSIPVTIQGVNATGVNVPSGTITVTSNGNPIATGGTATLGSPSAGSSSVTVNIPLTQTNGFTATGSPYNIQVSYGGDGNYLNDPMSFSLTVLKVAPTTATVTSSAAAGSNVPYGAPITFNVAFTGVAGNPVNAGTVAIYDTLGAALTVCSAPTSNNTATCSITANTANNLGAGAHTISVRNLVDANYSLPATTTNTFSFTTVVAPTTTALVSNTNPSKPGQSVTFTATVSVTAPGSSPLTGTVQFNNNGSPISGCGPVTLTANQAQCTTTFNTGNASPGYPITAVYSGDTNTATSTSNTVNQIVALPQPTITVSSNNNNTAFGQPVTFTALVTGINGITPTGVVEFLDGTNVLVANAALTPTNPTGTAVATFTVSNPPLAGGTHAITAVYVPNGDPNYSTVTSAVYTQTVSKAGATITPVQFSVNPAVFGQPVTLTTTVAPSQAGAAVPGQAGSCGSAGSCTVTFFDGASVIGAPVTVVAGSSNATATTTATLSVGAHASITAVYNGDANFGTATSTATTLNVNPDATTTVITSITPSSASFGQTVVITARATANAPGAGHLSSNITFYDGNTGNPIGTSSVVDATGTASITISAKNPPLANPVNGQHNIIATYNGGPAGGVSPGDPNFLASTSTSSALTVGQATTSTGITSSANPSVTGQLVTFTATIQGSGNGASPTGTVLFQVNGVPQGTGVAVTPNAPGCPAGSPCSQAVLTLPSSNPSLAALPDGVLTITAQYSGDSNYSASTSPGLTQTVNKAPTTTVLSSSTNNTSVIGQNVTLTATVTVNAPGGGTPTGTVTFYNTVSNVPVSLGTAQLVPAPGQNSANSFIAQITPNQPLQAGFLSLTAVYSGDNGYLTSTSQPITQIVGKSDVTVSVTANLNPSIFGQPVTFTVTVAPVAPATTTPTGQAVFYDGGSQLVQQTLVGGQASYTVQLPPGTHNISVAYSGDANFNSFISGAVPAIVNRVPSSISLVSSAANAVASQVLTFTAQISPTPAPGVPFPSGQVAFFDGSNQIGVGQLASGVATFSTASLSTGLHYISAVYSGDTNWTGATSSFVPENITLATTNIQIASSVNPSVFGQPVTFTINIGVAFPGTVPASGQVQLYDNTVAVGAAGNVANGTVQITLSDLAPGTHNIVAQYLGNGSFGPVTSSAVTQVVNKAPTVTSMSALPTSSSSSQQVTLQAVVTVPTPGAGTPTGTVQFLDATSNTVLATAPLTSIGGVFTATATTSQLNQAGAPRLLTATYSGDADFATSTSPAVPVSVFGTSITVTNAAGYTGTNFSPDGAASIFVSGLVTTTITANTLPLPNSLGGVTVTVTDSLGVSRQAALYFISPNQINFLMPTNTAFGLATIVVTNASGATASGIVLVTHTAPGIFAANQNGQGVAQALVLDVTPTGGQSTSNTAIYDPTSGLWGGNPIVMNSTDSYFLELYGTGIRYAPANGVTATINGISVPVQYAGAQPQYPGLDQVNIGPLPASLKGAGTVNVVVTVAGQAANTVTVTFQ